MIKEGQQHHRKVNSEISFREIVIRIREWWRYLLSKWITIIGFALLGGAIGFWYVGTKKPVYTATTTFVLEDEKSGSGLSSLAGLAAIASVDLGVGGGGIFQGDNIYELYKSRKMVVQTLLSEIQVKGKKQLLVERYIDFNGLRKNWVERPDLKSLSFKIDSVIEGTPALKSNRLRDSVLTSIVSDITKNALIVGKPDKKLSIVRVDVSSRDEMFAKEFNEKIVRNVNNFYLQTKTKKSLQNVKIMQRKTDSVRAVMNGDIYTAVAVADATPNLNPTRQVQRIAPAQKAQFSAEANKAILSALVQNLEMSKVSLMKETPLLQVIDEPFYPLPITRSSKLLAIVAGCFVFGLLAVLVLIFKKVFDDLNLNGGK